MQLLNYVQNNMNNIIRLTIEHLQITGISIITAIVIGVPLGIFVTRYKRLADPILATANVFQTIPSIAFFGLLIPFLGIGKETAILVLFLYALLPIIKNTYTGINEVSQSLIDAGRGMGMTNFQILRMVELPQSLAVIMAGVRIATVINIGSATIAAYIGAGGLGELIFKGIQMYRNDMILVGAVLAALLAVIADKLLGYVEFKFTPRGIK